MSTGSKEDDEKKQQMFPVLLCKPYVKGLNFEVIVSQTAHAIIRQSNGLRSVPWWYIQTATKSLQNRSPKCISKKTVGSVTTTPSIILAILTLAFFIPRER